MFDDRGGLQIVLPGIFNVFLLVLSLLASVASARASKIIVLEQPAFGCAEKADLARSVSDLRKEAHCILLSKGPIRVDRVEGTYACVRRPPYPCLWVPFELIGVSIKNDTEGKRQPMTGF